MMRTGGPQWPMGPIPMIEPDHLPEILAATSDIAFVVSKTGVILTVLVDDAEPEGRSLSHWVSHSMRDFLASDSVGKFDDILTRVADAGRFDMPVELNHAEEKMWPYPVRYTVHRVGSDGDILMLGRDLRQVAETQQQLVQAQIALERGYEERREFDARYRMLLASTSDAFIFVSASDGRIRDLNAPAASLLGGTREELTGAPIAQEFKDRRRGEFVENLVTLAVSEVSSDLAVQTRRSRKDVLITPTVFRAAGERLIICRLTPDSDQHQVNDRLTHNLALLFNKSTDAVVFADTKGVIEIANEAYLELVDAANPSDVKGRSLADFMARGQIDLSVVLENALRSGHMRIYATKLTNEYGTRTPVEMSVVYLNNSAKPTIGFIMRDASRVEAIRSAANSPVGPAAVDHNVAELVGSATLKEIVAETNDVIEKMCIETAVELTRNNRAAAAEMLGLSRQSLYVKLRKYGLLKKDDDD
ncbi:PAS fold protein [Maliponia aquimaris]|uniref:PAS fold protein n=2 Tax=Maliponia aquimaris TaxID=1673631 RepID=A0A238JMY2_9RHOB|nr:PAS fold protein [Maliponia aquimaris]